MTGFGEAVAILGPLIDYAAAATGLHAWFTGLQTGRQLDEALVRLEQAHKRIEILSERILLVPWLQQVYPIGGQPQILINRQQIREVSEPVAERLHSKILLGSVVSTPPKLREALRKDPRNVLIDVRPSSEVEKHSQPNLIPVLFVENGSLYTGWQARGALPLMMDCEYKPFDAVISPETTGEALKQDRVILDLPAIRTVFFSVHRKCRIVLTESRLSFVDRENPSFSWTLDRVVISQFRARNGSLELETMGGRRHRLEASSMVLEKLLEELRGY